MYVSEMETSLTDSVFVSGVCDGRLKVFEACMTKKSPDRTGCPGNKLNRG